MSTRETLTCPHCGQPFERYRNPFPTVDVIIEWESGIVLVRRKHPPYGWALPGGFVDYGESVEDAAIREAFEETNLDIVNPRMFHVYSAPDRDPRFHTITTVFVAQAKGILKAKDDARDAEVFGLDDLPSQIVFDHGKILQDYLAWKTGKSEGMLVP